MNNYQEFFDHAAADAVPVRGFLHRPFGSPEAALVLTHGAGANCTAPLLVAVANALCDTGWMVLRCDLPFRQARPAGSATAWQRRARSAGSSRGRRISAAPASAPVSLGGHSYGGRQASMLAADHPGLVEKLLLFPIRCIRHNAPRSCERRTSRACTLRHSSFTGCATASPHRKK